MQFRPWKKESARKRGEPKTIVRQILYGVGSLLGVVILVSFTWYITRLKAFTITEVEVDGGETISHDDVRAGIEDELRGDYLKIIPHRFSFLYPHTVMVESLLRIPRIKDIAIVRKDRTRLLITFSEYIPYALWCASPGVVSECYFLNDDGFAFAQSPTLTGGALVRHFFSEHTPLAVGQMMSPPEFTKIHTFLERARDELSFRITDVLHTKDNDLYFGINGGGEVRITGTDSFDQVFDNLKSVLESKSFSHLGPGNFQYIDLRFGNKVFVNEELVSVATTTEENASATSTSM